MASFCALLSAPPRHRARATPSLDSREISIIVISSAVVVLLKFVFVDDPLSELFRVVRLELARSQELLAALVDPLV